MRLVDADKMIQEINNLGWGLYDTLTLKGLSIALKTIKEQPTAFDVDKVVEQLETRRKEYETASENAHDCHEVIYFRGIMRGYEYSKDIVKAGGIDE